ncbi:hypothetical protein HDA30_001179 [Micrococcus cohnii]|uniref:SAM-dependent methyltransferase n=1 Tax=Micrococcus cohnii TaxID=993416 RepID=A0A7W7GP70_9MICC|nr:class I SAM-dependent methyltransferase [Micrococcus cohnii]MBB4735671.1 hypothetical protein [Micrococcus cohnii]
MPRDTADRPSAAASRRDATELAPVLEPAGLALLDSLGRDDEDRAVADPLALSGRLRAAGHEPGLVAAVLTQLALRHRARSKLGEAAGAMLLTRDGVEQATRRVVAVQHARRLVAAGVRHVADLGCGIGADALAFADAGLEVTAVERDPVVAAAAAHNLADRPGVRVVTGDAVAWAREHADEVDALWFDPARRQIGGPGAGVRGSSRVFDPEAFSPPLSVVTGLAEAGRPVAVKLGPGLPHEHVPTGAEACWTSVGGDVTEVALYLGSLARADVRRAAHVLPAAATAEGARELISAAAAGASPELAAVGQAGLDELPGAVLYEPDGAIVRAGLVTDLAGWWSDQHGVRVRLLDEHLAYLIAEEALPAPAESQDPAGAPGGRDPAVPLAHGFRVEAVHPLDVKVLRRWARERALTRLDVKKRGVDVTPEKLRAQLLPKPGKTRGAGRAGAHATLVLARVGERRVALEVTPLGGV